ncbi:MAG: radical SAM protein [Chloroflexi bacterium]|nr:radical SAM protein [Chloroflexota bacterium]
MMESFEIGPIRPPSEAYSLLIRATRNCSWNRCKFCPVYKGQKFELRSVEEIKKDIETARVIQDKIREISWKAGHGDSQVREAAASVLNSPPNEAYHNVALWLYAGGENCFLQDSNTLIMKTPDLVEVIRFLKETLPSIKRITSYARSDTAARKTLEELTQLREAGLSRLHIGLESGYDPLLDYVEKGSPAAKSIDGGKKVVASGISLCEYVLLGLGGEKMWREHALDTAKALNQINPDFIRVRTLTVKRGMPLFDEVEKGNFVRATDERIVEEERLLIENLTCSSNFVSDHITNLLQEVEGKLPEDKEKMLAVIDRFQSLPPEDRTDFILGRRMGIYTSVDDLDDLHRRDVVEKAKGRLNSEGNGIDDKVIYSLMERFI